MEIKNGQHTYWKICSGHINWPSEPLGCSDVLRQYSPLLAPVQRSYHRQKDSPSPCHHKNFVIPLPHWLACYASNLFFVPQHILKKPGKKDRQVIDGSKQYTPMLTPVNMMTSTPLGMEEPWMFGSVCADIYKCFYNLCLMHPDRDLISHANDVTSCFCQIKLHPNIMGAFSYITVKQTVLLL